jgi:phosphohistidine swiveling domain-containing protein
MNPTLWLRVSEETSLPDELAGPERKRLEAIFDMKDERSPWYMACGHAGIRPDGAIALIRWEGSVPYMNWSWIVSAISHGMLRVVPADNGQGFSYEGKLSLRKLPGMLKSQWKVEHYAESILDRRAPPTDLDARLTESLGAGLALLALTLRLPKHTEAEFARWISDCAAAPRKVRATVERIQKLQAYRTALSHAWLEIFPASPSNDTGVEKRRMIWEGCASAEGDMRSAEAQGQDSVGSWQGLPVCPGGACGQWVLMDSDPRKWPEILSRTTDGSPRILVFAQARPQTTEMFGKAAAVVFVEGGVLSHACTVAREQGVPCVTGVGQGFIEALKKMSSKTFIQVDGAKGQVAVVKGATRPS